MDQFEIHLEDTGMADGEITFAALGRITTAMQLLATRIGRDMIGQRGPGRSPATVENATTLRLRGAPRPGSTTLDVAVGADHLFDQVEPELGLEHDTVTTLFELMSALAVDKPPLGVTPQIGTAVVGVADALASAAARCEFKSTGRRTVAFTPGTVTRSAWPTEELPSPTRPDTVVTGWLDLVDLRRARFRLRDAVGNDIVLTEVVDPEAASRLVNSLVTATGAATVGARGQIVSVEGARITATYSSAWSVPLVDLSSASAPVPGGVPGVTDADLDQFLAMIRE